MHYIDGVLVQLCGVDYVLVTFQIENLDLFLWENGL